MQKRDTILTSRLLLTKIIEDEVKSSSNLEYLVIFILALRDFFDSGDSKMLKIAKDSVNVLSNIARVESNNNELFNDKLIYVFVRVLAIIERYYSEL